MLNSFNVELLILLGNNTEGLHLLQAVTSNLHEKKIWSTMSTITQETLIQGQVHPNDSVATALKS